MFRGPRAQRCDLTVGSECSYFKKVEFHIQLIMYDFDDLHVNLRTKGSGKFCL